MIKVKINGDNLRLITAGLVVGFVVALPVGAHALINDNEEPVVQQEEQEPEQSPEPTPEVTPLPEPEPTVSPEPTPEVTPTPVPEVIEPNETPVTEQAPVADLQVAIAIASAEHPGVEVISAKVKQLGAEKVYKVTFADGWRIYVSADDGELYIVKDNANKKKALHHYAKKQWSKKYGSWKPWSAKYKSHCKDWVKSQNWKTDNTNQEQPVTPTEETTMNVQRGDSNNRNKKSHHSSHHHHRNR